MLPLRRVFLDYDLGFLRIIANLWGVELEAGEVRTAADELASALLAPEAVGEMFQSLRPEARAALDRLLAAGGRLPVARFTRQFGEARAMGPARRDREQPWLSPASPVEDLWYRGLIGRAFAEAGQASQEFFFIPSDLFTLLPQPEPKQSSAPGQPAPAPAHVLAADTAIVDDVCTVLAYCQNAAHDPTWRRGIDPARFLLQPESLDLVEHLIRRLGLVAGTPPRPHPAPARPFLEAARSQQHQRLVEAWQTDATWSDLARVDGLRVASSQADGTPEDSVAARQAILALLAQVPIGEWWSLDSFVDAVSENSPDFLRPAGDYDSWYIQHAATGEYLRGFENWDRVEGALVRYVVCGPLYWLGIADRDAVQESSGAGDRVSAFRLTQAARALLHGEAWPAGLTPERLSIRAEGVIVVPRAANPYDRFTAARIGDWEEVERPKARQDDVTYGYRLSAGALARAKDQGVAVRHVLAFLNKASSNPVPKHLASALERWERAGTEAVLEETIVLRAKSAEVIELLRNSPKAKRYLGEALGPLAIAVKRSDWERLRDAMIEMGVLAEVRSR